MEHLSNIKERNSRVLCLPLGINRTGFGPQTLPSEGLTSHTGALWMPRTQGLEDKQVS